MSGVDLSLARQPDDARLSLATRRLAWAAAGSLAASVGLMVVLGLSGPSVSVPRLTSALPWPPYLISLHLSDVAVSGLVWLAVGIGGVGLAAALLAVRRGWRPRPRRLVSGCLLAVVALMVVPPLGSTDMLDYAIYGRIAVLGHSPYVMTPAQLTASGDPVGRFSPPAWRHAPSVYGPLATFSEWVASWLAGPSAAKAIFWLKVLNGLAFLSVALALDRLLRRDAAARARAHLLWSVNPLMLWAVVGGGHVDGLAAAAGFLGLLGLRRLSAARGLAAGLLIGAAIAVKAPFVFFLLGPAWAARRSPRTLAAVVAGAVAVVLPGYLWAGPAAVTAVLSRAGGALDGYQPWQLLARVLGMGSGSTNFINAVGLCAFVLLAPVFLWGLSSSWRAPAGLSSGWHTPTGLPFVQPVLAVSLAWLICTPQQRPWYDAMIFPLLAVLPATRLDWMVVLRALAGAVAELPGVNFGLLLHPRWLQSFTVHESHILVPLTLVAVLGALVWLCITGRWVPSGPRVGADPAEPGFATAS